MLQEILQPHCKAEIWGNRQKIPIQPTTGEKKRRLSDTQTENVRRKIFSNDCREREKKELLVCRLGVVASHQSLFPVSYRWRAESDYKGCHPSGPPAHAGGTQTEREHSCSVYTSRGRSLAARVHNSEVIEAPDIGGVGV